MSERGHRSPQLRGQTSPPFPVHPPTVAQSLLGTVCHRLELREWNPVATPWPEDHPLAQACPLGRSAGGCFHTSFPKAVIAQLLRWLPSPALGSHSTNRQTAGRSGDHPSALALRPSSPLGRHWISEGGRLEAMLVPPFQPANIRPEGTLRSSCSFREKGGGSVCRARRGESSRDHGFSDLRPLMFANTKPSLQTASSHLFCLLTGG